MLASSSTHPYQPGKNKREKQLLKYLKDASMQQME